MRVIECTYPFDTKKYKVDISHPQGDFAHERSPVTKYAIDFILPLDAEVLAAHRGKVIYTKSDSDRHYTAMEAVEKGWSLGEMLVMSPKITNRVCVKSGEIYFEYAHLGKDKVVVNVGDKVNEGDLIGDVGMSGFTDLLHLHFNVARKIGIDWKSIPVKFKPINK
jgi:murein DD-endopeptidase MepM/ murein hydrolase activator NlpD